MASLAQVRQNALGLLGVIVSGGTVSTADDARMTIAYEKVYAELEDMGLATWVSTSPVPDKLSMHVEALMAYEASGEYLVPELLYNRIVMKESKARREMRRLTTPDYESLEEPVDY